VDLSTWQSNHPSGHPVTHLDPYPTDHHPPGRLLRRASFRLDSAVSPIPPQGIGRWGGGGVGWGGEDGGPLDRAARVTAVVGGLGGCLDPLATGP
jgi:hypothetical protein